MFTWLLTPFVLFAQEVVPPESWADLYENYGAFFGTYLGIAGIATFVSEYVIRLIKLTARVQKVIVVVLLAIGVSFLSMWWNIGYLAEATWWETALWGGLSAAAAAGLRSANLLFAKTIVDFIINYIKSKEPSA
jgi:hypothetical protein